MKRMNSLVFASWALLMPLMPSLAAETQAVSAKPNIILILSDDV